jgi:hypothetical protein
MARPGTYPPYHWDPNSVLGYPSSTPNRLTGWVWRYQLPVGTAGLG